MVDAVTIKGFQPGSDFIGLYDDEAVSLNVKYAQGTGAHSHDTIISLSTGKALAVLLNVDASKLKLTNFVQLGHDPLATVLPPAAPLPAAPLPAAPTASVKSAVPSLDVAINTLQNLNSIPHGSHLVDCRAQALVHGNDLSDVFVFQSTYTSKTVDGATEITNYQHGADFIGLAGGLNFSGLKVAQGIGAHVHDTVISLTNGSTLAVLLNVNAAQINAKDFIQLGADSAAAATAHVASVPAASAAVPNFVTPPTIVGLNTLQNLNSIPHGSHLVDCRAQALVHGNDLSDVFAFQSTYASKTVDGATEITNYQHGADFIGLAGGLNFSSVKIAQGTGAHSHDTVVSLTNGSTLAVLVGVNASQIGAHDFISLG